MEPYTPHPLPLPLSCIDWTAHITNIGRANAALARYDGILQGVPNPGLLLAPLTTREAVLSSRIEGTQASFEDVLQYEAKVRAKITPERTADIQEIINYREAMQFAVRELAHRPFSINLIRDLHRILLSSVRGRDKEPGEIRHTQNYIGRPGTPIEQAIFIPPRPEIVMDALSNWESYLHAEEKDVLVQLAVLKAQFELIHPFRDGNGRIGRMLVPLVLFRKRMISQPMFYISAYLEANRDIYYDRLNGLSREDDWNGWITFFLGAVVAQSEENCQKARAILDLYNDMKQRIPEIIRSQYTIQAIDAIFSRPIFSATDFSANSGIPKRSALRILAGLIQHQVIVVLEEAKGSQAGSFQFPDLVRIVDGDVRQV
ncbi:MAG: Fic/DOC family protein [Methanoregulaceae archaeon PtaU1.Bin066]|nr:MAG: Fic/DOC family protein [Methanoregulaceae archaeon PtaU1.Bin066]